MKQITLLIAMAFYGGLVWAQTNPGQVEGTVHDQKGNPVPYASVALKGSTYGDATNENGEFQFNAPAGQYVLEVSEVGFGKINGEVKVVAGETTRIPTISLKEKEALLGEFIITGNRSEYKVDQPSGSLRLGQPLIETPQNIQVVTAKALEDQQVLDMSDGVLRNVSGATRLEHWGNLYARVNMRGSRAAAFRNGMNVTSNWGPLNEDMSFVSHVEFVKGPAGFMMSNGEPSGMYNVVTKKPTGETRGNVNLTMGSFDLYRGTLDLDGQLDASGRLLYRLNVMGQTQNSFQDYTFTNRYSIAPVLSYQLDPKTTLTLEYVYQHVKMSNVGSAYVFSTEGYGVYDRSFTVAEPGLDPTRINDHSVMVNLQHELHKDWKVTGQLAYFNYNQVGSSMWLNGIDEKDKLVRYVSIWDAINENAFGQIYLNGEVKTGVVNHRVLAGLDMGTKEYLADWSQSHQLDSLNGGQFDMNNPVYGSPVNGLPQFDRSKSLKQRANTTAITQSYSGFYLQDELGFLDNSLRLTLAGRYTFVKENSYGTALEESQFTPRLGLSYSFDHQTSAYALYDQSFVPQTGLLRNDVKPKPITGNNMEVGLKRDWMDGRWSSSLSVYRILKNNQLVPDPDPTDNADNRYSIPLGQTKTQGLEFDVRGELVPGLMLVANYAYTHAEISEDTREDRVGQSVPGFAKHLANGWLSYQVGQGRLKGLGLSAGFTFQGDRSTWSWAADNQLDLPDYFKLDGGVSWENDRISIRANVFNMLDKYLYSGSAYATYYYYQAEAPRNARLTLGFKF